MNGGAAPGPGGPVSSPLAAAGGAPSRASIALASANGSGPSAGASIDGDGVGGEVAPAGHPAGPRALEQGEPRPVAERLGDVERRQRVQLGQPDERRAAAGTRRGATTAGRISGSMTTSR